MSKFKVDLTASDRPERFTEEGNYTVTIANVERLHTPRGDEKAVITFVDDKNRTVKDDILNKETVYWRLNQLLIASGMKVPHGTEYDFSRAGEFFNFVKSFVGQRVGITLKFDSYDKRMPDGTTETKKYLKVQRFVKSDNVGSAPTASASSADVPF